MTIDDVLLAGVFSESQWPAVCIPVWHQSLWPHWCRPTSRQRVFVFFRWGRRTVASQETQRLLRHSLT